MSQCNRSTKCYRMLLVSPLDVDFWYPFNALYVEREILDFRRILELDNFECYVAYSVGWLTC